MESSKIVTILLIIFGLVSVCCAIFCIATVTVILSSYFGLGGHAYDSIFRADTTACSRIEENNPSSFGPPSCQRFTSMNLSQWFVPQHNWTSISFPSHLSTSEDPKILSGYLLENQEHPNAPMIVAIHGFRACKKSHYVLTNAGILWRAGYHVFIPDLRNHGESFMDSGNPYVTYGWKEHRDVIDGLDYIFSNYSQFAYLDDKVDPKVGLYACSMGGAVSTILLEQDDRVKAAFVESSVCGVLDTLFYNSNQLLAGSGGISVRSACDTSIFKTSNGCPPFDLNPMKSAKQLGARKHFFWQHSISDLKVPFEDSEKCMEAAKESGANVTSYAFDKAKELDEKLDRDSCDNHCHMALYDPEGHENRIKTFFSNVFNY